MKTKVSKETLKALNGLKSEVTAGMILFPQTMSDRAYNQSSQRTLRLLNQYIEGEGLFQQPTDTKEEKQEDANPNIR